MIDKRTKTFIRIVEMGTFSAAARELFITQPTATQQVKSLESQLSVTLFERGGGRARLTAAGRVVYEHLKRIEEIEREMMGKLEALTPRKRLTIGFPSITAHDDEYFSALVSLAMEVYPDAQVDTVYVPGPPDNLSCLTEGKADIMVSAIEPLTEFRDVRFARRHPISFYLVCARDHPLASRERVGIGDLDGETIYLLDIQPNRHLNSRRSRCALMCMSTYARPPRPPSWTPPWQPDRARSSRRGARRSSQPSQSCRSTWDGSTTSALCGSRAAKTSGCARSSSARRRCKKGSVLKKAAHSSFRRTGAPPFSVARSRWGRYSNSMVPQGLGVRS